jgi:hypothetical protein
MDLKCEDVWREISNYIDEQVDSELRQDIARHLASCKKCAAVYAGTRNIVLLYGDERMFSLPAEFAPALRRRLSSKLTPERGSDLGWVLSLAGAGLIAAMLLVFSLPRFAPPPLRAPMSDPAVKAASGMVAVNDEGKTFHVPGCTFLHGKSRMIPLEEALREGYNPCIRCESEFLRRADSEPVDTDPAEHAAIGQ